MTIKNKTVIGLLTLLCVVTVGGEAKVIAAQSAYTALSPYELIDPGIQANVQSYCWYDDERLIFLLGQYSRSSGGMFQSGGLYYLDIRKPTEHHRIDLSPLSESEQKTLNNVYCKDETILFSLGSSSLAHPDRRRAYSLKLGERPELIAEMRGLANPLQSVHLKAKYILGNSRRIVQEGPLKGAFEGHDDCSVAYVKPGFKVLCWDTWLKAHWPLSKFVIAEYRWEDRIKVKGEDGKKKYVPNPEKSIIPSDGKSVYGLFLRDLNNQVIVNLHDDPTYVGFGDIKTSADERFAYATCRYRRLEREAANWVCRYLLDGKKQRWEEVLSLRDQEVGSFIIHGISVSPNSDIYFLVQEIGKNISSIWKYSTQAKKISRVTQPPRHRKDEKPEVSPDGTKVAFIRPEGYRKIFIVNTISTQGGTNR